MPLKASYCKHTLNFKFDAGTSRGILKTKDSYYIKLHDSQTPETFGVGEAAPLKGLSIDYKPEFEPFIKVFLEKFNTEGLESADIQAALSSEMFLSWPSIRFAFEMALLDLQNGGKRTYFQNAFSEKKDAIEINGLIWMGDEAFMSRQIIDKLKAGFRTLKMKIGAIDFDTEYKLLKSIRSNFPADELTLRVDANGAFTLDEAQEVLKELKKLDIHSIEQPIKANQWESMAKLCQETPVPIALDEELIGINGAEQKKLLDAIKPQFLIFKPTLLGGFAATDNWIDLAAKQNIDWWITSALEANIGLNAICQYTYSKNNLLPQGLGTGSLFENNTPSPLDVFQGAISLGGKDKWDLSGLAFDN
ncbi:o-succinylbenzoate synthase [uncultured Arcticibacterium sp.]|uniref:o-succinylbenzoate synthase n=1 Tax=uncultured Arcticibacterium sp. TaxID=2173042 RepID=UPI0030F95A72